MAIGAGSIADRDDSVTGHHHAVTAAQAGHASVAGYDVVQEADQVRYRIGLAGQHALVLQPHTLMPGLFLVFMPTVDHVGVSRKIASPRRLMACCSETIGTCDL